MFLIVKNLLLCPEALPVGYALQLLYQNTIFCQTFIYRNTIFLWQSLPGITPGYRAGTPDLNRLREHVNIQVELREFKRTDNIEYSSWFTDPSINKHLGPAWNSAELDQILREDPVAVLSAFHANEMVGVVALAFPDKEYPAYGITGVAVKPQAQRRGIGTATLSALQYYYRTPQGQEWVSFININNASAGKFMEKQGWKQAGVENDMYRYIFIQHACLAGDSV